MTPKQKAEILKIVKNNYAAIATQFAETRNKPLWPKLKELTADVPSGSSVLDVGCGSGRLLEGFGDKKIEYLGVDSSQELINLAKEKYPKNNFCHGDILDLSFLPKGSFSYVFNIAVLHHLPDASSRLQALGELSARAKKGGVIIISVMNLWSQTKYLKIIFKTFFSNILKRRGLKFGDTLFYWRDQKGKKISQRYYHAFTFKELKTLARLANLKIKRLRKDKFNYWLILEK